MHDDEADAGPALARRLVAEQFPRWAELPLTPVVPRGTDNALYRLGEDLALRLPRISSAAAQGEKERRWLPRLAEHLPLPVPVPIATGRPAAGYPWAWSVCRWVDGERVAPGGLADARWLAAFVGALRRFDPDGGPPPGDHNFARGAPLATRDAAVRAALGRLAGEIDTGAAAATWEAAVTAPVHPGPAMWIHGDLHAGNLLCAGGRLCGVVDFGGLGVGDPACDVMAAWTALAAEARPEFRAALGVDDAEWTRGRGWALSMGLIALPYYRERDPRFAETALGWVEAALAG